MTPSDSKKLEEIKRRAYGFWELTAEQQQSVDWLITQLEEKNREITGLRLDGWVDLSTVLEYQRRHRKWALEQCRTWARHFCFYKDDAVRFHSDRADKAAAQTDVQYKRFLIAHEDRRKQKDRADKAEAELAKIKKGGVKSY